MAGSNETKAKSAHFQVKLPTGAELGNFFDLKSLIMKSFTKIVPKRRPNIQKCSLVAKPIFQALIAVLLIFVPN